MKQKIKRDGHIHTPFCPHGSKDALEAYVEEAIRLGREEISFTEHFPLPDGVTNEAFKAECALDETVIPQYFEAIEEIKEKYRGKITIHKGFEVDYVEGKEVKIKELLNRYGAEIEDSILSVHFVRYENAYYAVDYKPEVEVLLKKVGSIEDIYKLYYETVKKSIEADLGAYKPKRIGHPSLVRIFNKIWPCTYEDGGMFEEIAQKLVAGGYEIDLNVAGLRKDYCKETYPTGKQLDVFRKYNIPYVLGSDSHEVSQLALLSRFEECL